MCFTHVLCFDGWLYFEALLKAQKICFSAWVTAQADRPIWHLLLCDGWFKGVLALPLHPVSLRPHALLLYATCFPYQNFYFNLFIFAYSQTIQQNQIVWHCRKTLIYFTFNILCILFYSFIKAVPCSFFKPDFWDPSTQMQQPFLQSMCNFCKGFWHDRLNKTDLNCLG